MPDGQGNRMLQFLGSLHSCCHTSTQCADFSSSGMCCPTGADCSQQIERDSHCANNKTWDLYYSNGYFCCLSTSVGYKATNLVSDGEPASGVAYGDEYPSGSENVLLIPIARGSYFKLPRCFAHVLGLALIEA
ncbi:hypothetical protein BDV12DRAFT_161342 [Aspergillus spectabilis]